MAANSTTPASEIDVSWTAPTTTQMSGKPAVDDYDVQYRLAGDTDWTDASFTGTTTSTTLTGLTAGKTYEVQVRAGNHEGDGPWSDTGNAITDASGVTRSVAENSVADTNVGAAVTAKSTNTTYTYTHALSGTDASSFEIGSATGQITVKSGTSLDYETKSSYSVIVTVTAAAKTQGANAQSVDPNAPGDYIVPVTINVTDVNRAAAQDGYAHGGRQLHHSGDQAGRELDGPNYHADVGQAGGQRLRRSVSAFRRNRLDGCQLYRNHHQHRLDRADCRQDLRRAG